MRKLGKGPKKGTQLDQAGRAADKLHGYRRSWSIPVFARLLVHTQDYTNEDPSTVARCFS